MRAIIVFEDWRLVGQAGSIYQTELGLQLSAGDLHSGTQMEAEIVFGDPEIESELLAAWRTHQAYPVFRIMPSEQGKPVTGTPYRPSNGTESEDFHEAYCYHCKRDDFDSGGDGCDIMNRSLAFNLSDPNYPREWQYDADGDPICTAFEEEEAP